MAQILYRTAGSRDLAAIARLRAMEWGDQEYWERRVADYLSGEQNPRQAQTPRVVIVAETSNELIGFIAGHLTERFSCDGELEWINVLPEYRGKGVSSNLLNHLWVWFHDNKALKICVDVEPENLVARKFYGKHGAIELNPHWMIWHNISQRAVSEPAR